MSSGLWAHALALAALGERRARAGVLQRFVQAQPRRDVLHTLYAHLAAKLPPAAAVRMPPDPDPDPRPPGPPSPANRAAAPQDAADERWGDWRPHAAIMLSNASAKPDQDRRTLMQLGEARSSPPPRDVFPR